MTINEFLKNVTFGVNVCVYSSYVTGFSSGQDHGGTYPRGLSWEYWCETGMHPRKHASPLHAQIYTLTQTRMFGGEQAKFHIDSKPISGLKSES